MNGKLEWWVIEDLTLFFCPCFLLFFFSHCDFPVSWDRLVRVRKNQFYPSSNFIFHGSWSLLKWSTLQNIVLKLFFFFFLGKPLWGASFSPSPRWLLLLSPLPSSHCPQPKQMAGSQHLRKEQLLYIHKYLYQKSRIHKKQSKPTQSFYKLFLLFL